MTKRLVTAIAAVCAAVLLASCGGSSNGTTNTAASTTPQATTPATTAAPAATAPADEAAAKAEITANWHKFFAYTTPPAVAATLLEHGDQMEPALTYAQHEQATTHIKQGADVSLITFTSATNANVVYKLLNGKTVLLPTASGVAILDNGVWKVSKVTFCTLVQLGANGATVPGC